MNWEADLFESETSDYRETVADLFEWEETAENGQQADGELENIGESEIFQADEAGADSAAIDELNWEADLFESETSDYRETAADLFEWEETAENGQQADAELDSLFSEEDSQDYKTGALAREANLELNWEADLFVSESVNKDLDLQPTAEIENEELESELEELLNIGRTAVEEDSALKATEQADWLLEVESDSLDEFADLAEMLGSPTASVASELENLDEFADLAEMLDSPAASVASELENLDEFENLEAMLDSPTASVASELENLDEFADLAEMLDSPTASVASELENLDEFADLEAMLGSPTASVANQLDDLDEFANLESMLGSETTAISAASKSTDWEGFDDLESLLSDEMLEPSVLPSANEKKAYKHQDQLDEDLEALLKQAEQTMGGQPATLMDQRQARALPSRRIKMFEQTMRVPVKHLDSLSNLVGELVVSRNSLEQDQERLRQFLDNLQHQVVALSDVGARMRDLYERSLLESSLLASRHNYRSSALSDGSSQNNNSSGAEYHPLEMDRFTGFHLLSQEMIELIVQVRESASDIEFLVDETDQVARNLRQVTTQLQEGLTRSRMVPFGQNADKLLRAVRDISMKLGKEAELHIEGRETLIDKMILEHLNDPMTHLVNNALTHGIELPDVRKAAGKPRSGQITLRAFHQGNQTVISISDDGAGINSEKVRRKAIEKGLITQAEAKKLTPVDLYDFLFHPGFTTKDKADDFAGRGVGMDVVRTSLSEIRGAIYIDSTIGKGTTFTIRLPLTLSICKALCCLSDHARIAFPMDGVEDMMDLPYERVQTNAEGQTCISWRDSLLPFQPLSELLTYNRQISRSTIYGGKREDNLISIVVLRSAGNFIALQVDQVLGEQEIVIKQLEGPSPKPVGIAGATVLGDGRIMPIADVLELIDLSMGRIRRDGGGQIWGREEGQEQIPPEEMPTQHEPLVLIVDDSITVRELLSMTFAKAGYRVEQARDGQEAWEKLRSGLPCDIVFCDIEMPRMDGLELLSRLQKDENLSHLPIAMLTSRGAKRHRQMASQLGASGYFTKPYLEEMLLDAAQRMIKGEVLLSASED